MSKLIGPGADQLSVNADLSRTAFIDPEHLPLSDPQIQALALKLDYRQWEKQELLRQAALLLDFENNRYVRDEGIGDWMTSRPLTDILTFSRAGSATGVNRRGVLQTVSANVPVFENRGLRLRPAETNSVGADIAGSNWSNSGPNRLTMGPVVQIAGFDLRQATIAVGATPGAYVQWLPQITITPGRVTMSTYIRHDTPGWAHVILRDDSKVASAYAFFNLATGVVGNAAGDPAQGITLVDATLEPLNDGVWRLDLVIQTDGTQIRPYLFGQVAGNGNISSEGLIGNVWYAAVQVNQGDPAPYIPTTTAAVTRPADNVSIQGTDFASVFNPAEGAVVLRYQTEPGQENSPPAFQMRGAAPSNVDTLYAFVRPSGGLGLIWYIDNIQTAALTPAAIFDEVGTIAWAWDASGMQVFARGSKEGALITPDKFRASGWTRFALGNSGVGGNPNSKSIYSHLAIFTHRPTDAQLVTLTS